MLQPYNLYILYTVQNAVMPYFLQLICNPESYYLIINQQICSPEATPVLLTQNNTKLYS